MKDLTDLEICQRIAMIEGLKTEIFNGVLHIEDGMVASTMSSSGSYMSHAIYNPLTDDALCFRLMIKYKIDFCNYLGDMYAGVYIDKVYQNRSPNRAICLAIIEASSSGHLAIESVL